MAEIELMEKNSTSPQKLIDESNSEEKAILKEKSHARSIVFTIFLLFIILSITISILYRNSTSKAYIHDATKQINMKPQINWKVFLIIFYIHITVTLLEIWMIMNL